MNNEKLLRYQRLEDIENLNIKIGLATPTGEQYNARSHKPQQMLDYYETVKSVIKKLSTKRTLYLYDFCCGRSYLSFYLNHLLQKEGICNIEFICIDWNVDLIKRNQQTAVNLNMANMKFIHANVVDYEFLEKPDMVYSLHACDDATDQVIYKGITEHARFILSVSCCQHTNRKRLKSPPLSPVTRHKPYKERLVDMISDTLRSLLLEANGYKVSIFEFSSTTYTDKNIMLKCEKVGDGNEKRETLLLEYEKLSALFNVRPLLERYLMEHSKQEEGIGKQ